MGFSEWGVEIKSQAELERVKALVKAHNELKWGNPQRGEDLEFYAVLNFQGKKFALVCNGGGGQLTRLFVKQYPYKFASIYQPFEKPAGWREAGDYVWKKQKDGEPCPNNLFDIVGGVPQPQPTI